ncbi:uncharacterized protein LOC123302879 [Chrysoperla carnea]|uniref:uncharacterized protein LOC123302879 n=1 Tax=Chrysoperla carnea TaxID=189513 RepID=UPI001D08912C|nr:uncharacterized protein LOC123302879 [Chrysoperla carnea]
MKALMPNKVSDSTSVDSVKPLQQDNNLARINLPQFNGDIDSWLEFISIFDSLVHSKHMDNICSHLRSQCASKNVCRKCDSNQHHTTLHPGFQSPVTSATKATVSDLNASPSNLSTQPPHSTGNDIPALSCTSYAQNPQGVLLGTAQILINTPSGNYFSVRALVDPGSQVSIISLSCCRALGLPIKPTSTQISGIGATETSCHGTVSCILKSKYSDIKVSTTAYVMSTISLNLPSIELSQEVISRFTSLKLADSQFYKSSPVDFLIGADLFPSILSCTDSQTIQGFPSAINSIFGWLIIGPVEGNPPTQPISLLSTAQISDHLQNFWETEEVSVSIPSNPSDILAERHFKDTHSRDSTGRYIVALPFRPGSLPALFNKERSLASFINLEKRLSKFPEKYKAYTEFMDEYISLCHMSKATNSSGYIIPHHCVTKDTSTSTKLRVVFNASDPGYNKISLNSLLLAGPKLQNDISDILYSFRFNAIALCSDIRQMYRQILVRPEDRIYQHIFYRPSTESDVVEFELNTVTYGLVPSAFLAQRCLKQLVIDEGNHYPLASQALLHNTYVDDIITGASSPEQAKTLMTQLQTLMSRGGFELRKWTSNDPSILADLPWIAENEEADEDNIENQCNDADINSEDDSDIILPKRCFTGKSIKNIA